MQQRIFGADGPRVPVIGQGTWNMEGDDRKQAIAALRAGIDLGLTHIDTAELYGEGQVEALVGEAIAGRRDEVFLVSKVLPWNASARDTIAACERSLRRLGTGHLDCYLLHWPGDHPLADTLGAFERLVEHGKIRRYGVSNFGLDELEAAWAVVGPAKIACNQVLYHLQQRAIEGLVSPWCAARGIGVVTYSPLGSGDFPAVHNASGRILAEVAGAHDATPEQVALAFLARREHVFVIPKASRIDHVEANAAAGELELHADELARIDAAFASEGGELQRDVPML